MDWNFGDGNVISGSSISNNQYLNNGVFYPSATVEATMDAFNKLFLIIVSIFPMLLVELYTMNNFLDYPLPVQFNISTPLNTINLNFVAMDIVQLVIVLLTHTMKMGGFWPKFSLFCKL